MDWRNYDLHIFSCSIEKTFRDLHKNITRGSSRISKFFYYAFILLSIFDSRYRKKNIHDVISQITINLNGKKQAITILLFIWLNEKCLFSSKLKVFILHNLTLPLDVREKMIRSWARGNKRRVKMCQLNFCYHIKRDSVQWVA